MKLDKDEYFSDDRIIEDELYLTIKDLIKCPLCFKILKDPYMCIECQNAYCKKCVETYSNFKKCPNDGKKTKFSHSIQKNDLLSKLRYRCKNCNKEVKQTDIQSHLKTNCKQNDDFEKEKSLIEEIQTKKGLIKLSKEEMKNKKADKTLTGKKIFYKIILFLFLYI